MENENSNNEAENLTEPSTGLHGTKEAANPTELSTALQSSEMNAKEAERITVPSTRSKSFENTNGESENIAGTSTKAQSSKRRAWKSLKARANVTKKSSAGNSLKNNVGVLPGNKETNKEKSKDSNGEANKDKSKDSNEECSVDPKEIQKSEERVKMSDQNEKNKKREEKRDNPDSSSRKRKKRGNVVGKKNSQADDRQKDRQQDEGKRRSPEDGKKKEIQGDDKKNKKLGGLIFMCNAKTKPDCFRYCVMGVTMGKKDIVLSVKPGLKLFLYDYDLKLMYGVYQASSSGGIRLEPKAFGGNFPAQVRFSVYKDCYPLSESVFKKAMKENYDDRNKFKTELTVRQVRKLSELFQLAVLQSTQPAAIPVHAPPVSNVRDNEVYEGGRGTRSDGRSYPVLSHDRDWHLGYRDMLMTQREEIPRNLYMSEKDYRMYGLQAQRRNSTSLHPTASTLDPSQRRQERDYLLRPPDTLYREAVPMRRDSVLVEPFYSAQTDLRAYELGGNRELPLAVPLATTGVVGSAVTATASGSAVAAADTYSRDLYYTSHYRAVAPDAYLPPIRREEVSSVSYYLDGRRMTYAGGTDPLHNKREPDQLDKLYATAAVDAMPNYSEGNYYPEAKPGTATSSVTSRYSFAGPSVTYM